ncbi:GMC oxidoreductase [Cyanobium sp. Morenito 9A2]|uniref:GMC oxidoreductase n=1 Tax=Cyanobium sp. Morenito 9A2 TaxID=2823718 RepID=UPI0020CBCEF1|nr:GMC family oxidoreductase [Cyanobium sp. Morenito 9A2]MCP9848556.1 GMC family oxidoreductase [Cyanobium sp. Morenito 9A2]
MIIDDHTYDLIVIGTGAGGGTLAGALAECGKSVLVLERGGAMDLSDQNVADVELVRNSRYHPGEQWFGTDGDPFPPQMIYALGGNSKIWGGVLERLREQDFAPQRHLDGSSPGWELSYADLAPHYDRAERLYHVHGRRSVDPTEPPRTGDYLHPPRSIEPVLESLRADLARQGVTAYDLPISWSASPLDPSGDAERFGVDVAELSAQVTLRTGARVIRLHVNPSGREVKGVQAEIDGQNWLFTGHVVVLAAGAVNSAALLLRSCNDQHPEGLANGSGQVGRNLMKPQLSSILQLAAHPDSGRYGPGLGINDYYWGDKNVSVPLGQIRNGGGVLQDPLFAESPPLLSLVTRLLPNSLLEQLAVRTVSWWASSGVRPDPANRVSLRGEGLQITYTPNNREAHDRLVYRWLSTIKALEADPATTVVRAFPLHPRGESPLAVLGFACGTVRMGSDPTRSVVDLQGRSHQLVNLYVADASVFPTCPAVGPALTVIALALRLAEHLKRVL